MLNRSLRMRPFTGRRGSRGLSLIEMMVAVAIGLFLVSGALTLFVSNVVSSRRLSVETRMNQEMRAAADLIARDVRRAGYWANAISGTINSGASTATTRNPYGALSGSYGSTSSTISYEFARDSDNTLADAERFGFKLANGAIQMQTAGGTTPTWQDVTDPNVMTVTTLRITDTPTAIAVGDRCTRGCNTTPPTPASAPTTACPNPPTLTLHRIDVLIEAQGASDASVRRTLRESVRLRNNQITGFCP